MPSRVTAFAHTFIAGARGGPAQPLRLTSTEPSGAGADSRVGSVSRRVVAFREDAVHPGHSLSPGAVGEAERPAVRPGLSVAVRA